MPKPPATFTTSKAPRGGATGKGRPSKPSGFAIKGGKGPDPAKGGSGSRPKMSFGPKAA